MTEALVEKRFETAGEAKLSFQDHHASSNDDQLEILQGLRQAQKTINPKFFYDTHGSELFELITALPEYYPARTERSILRDNADEIADYCGREVVLIEPGSGSSEKVRLLLPALQPKAYVPMDIAGEFLQRAAIKLGGEFPALDVQAICADFSQLPNPPATLPHGKRVIFYPGSTLGNMTPDEAVIFLSKLRSWLLPSLRECSDSVHEHELAGGVLIGIDLHKENDILTAAYNDQQGVTAEFNLNVLANVNRLTGANIDVNKFKHHAFYNEQLRRIEMHLISQQAHNVSVLDEQLSFAQGESIHTENSYKYTIESFSELVARAGFRITKSWLDGDQLFSVHYLQLEQ
ncbi:dimethylhistidine N-methyltransferase [Sinobacterium caligoides]|uniref:Dimethylhistidine N-methyltransferase n=1 Tax=Sinobacterium caligoides TaxID=933926 RepID=A0A3N2E0C2_9GAMM|nr:L-histidine N(alpha)-methyltransferase [Sinobacterium caligoides]ROS05546.1 dimethylhistidine N-methyltransferase [Sinobacterium caligoides]